MTYIATIVFLLLALTLFFWEISLFISIFFGAPVVDARPKTLASAFELAKLKRQETVVDFGCSDAHVLLFAAKKFQARGLGVEISPFYYLKARLKVFFAGQNRRIKIKYGDLTKNLDLARQADVVYLYLLTKIIAKIEDELFATARHGTRIVTIGFKFSHHQPKVKKVIYNSGRPAKLFLYEVGLSIDRKSAQGNRK